MESLKIKRHPFKYYFVVGVILPALFLLGLYFFYLAYQEIFSEGGIVLYFWLLLGLLLTLLPGSICLTSIQASPAITVKDGHLIFNGKKKYTFDEIKNVELTALLYNREFNFLGGNDGVVIELKNGSRNYLYDDQYLNLSDLRRALNAGVLKRENPTEKSGYLATPREIPQSDIRWIRLPYPSKLEVFINIFIIFWLLPSIYRWFIESPISLVIMLFLSLVGLIFPAILRVNRIGTSDTHLWIKRLLWKGPILPGRKKHRDVIPFEQIEKAAILREGFSTRLRLILKDFSIVNYRLVTSKNEKLDELYSQLMEKNIPVVKRY